MIVEGHSPELSTSAADETCMEALWNLEFPDNMLLLHPARHANILLSSPAEATCLLPEVGWFESIAILPPSESPPQCVSSRLRWHRNVRSGGGFSWSLSLPCRSWRIQRVQIRYHRVFP